MLLLFITLTFARPPLEGRIFHKGDDFVLRPGIVFDAVLEISPVRKSQIFPSLENTTILDALYVFKVEKKIFNENVLSFHIKAVFKKHLDPGIIHHWSFGDKKISLSVSNMDVERSFHKKEKDFIIYRQKGDSQDSLSVVIFVLILLALLCLVFLVVYRRKTREKRMKWQKRYENYLKWKKIFLNAKNRCDYESISLKKNEWMNLCKDNSILVRDFLNSINSCQYKKEWNNKELTHVETSFNKIRRILKEQI